MNKTVFKGTCTAAITPFTENGIDLEAFGRQIDRQTENSIEALCVLGTTGEASTVTEEEYTIVASFAREKIGDKAKLILGTGSNCTKKAIEKSVLAQKLGADGLLVVTPYYNKCTQKGLVKYYNDICENSEVPVICYNVPSRTGVNILPETMAEIAENPKIGGIKEACGNLVQIEKTAKLIAGKTALYSGDDGLNFDILKLGSYGLISVASNVMPKEVGDVARLFYSGDEAGAKALQEKLLPLMNAMFTEVNPIPVKKAAELLGLDSGIVRAPLTELEPQHEESLKQVLLSYGLKVKLQ